MADQATKQYSRSRRLYEGLRRLRARQRNFLARRPHRSFKLTRRRDYVRSLDLPGYVAFTAYVAGMLWRHKKTFLGLMAVYLITSIMLVSMTSQTLYTELADAVREAGQNADLNAVYQSTAIFVGTITSSFSGGNADSPQGAAQQIFGGLLVLLAWLSTVWLLRHFLAKRKVRLRDALYSSGGPLIATMLLFLLLIIQMLPLIFAVIAYSAASASGILESTITLMLFWGAAFLIGVLSLYWATTTVIALVVITLPSMYPMQALRLAGDIVVGRRVRILLRLLWLVLLLGLTWIAIVIPSIFIYEFLQSRFDFLTPIPVVPFIVACMSAYSVIWSASYVYLLYRKIVDDNADPA